MSYNSNGDILLIAVLKLRLRELPFFQFKKIFACSLPIYLSLSESIYSE